MDLSGRNTVIFDIETVGDAPEEFSAEMLEYLTKYADTEEKRAETIEQFVFNPLTSKIAAIGMMDNKTEKGCVLINSADLPDFKVNHEGFAYLSGSEGEIIAKFWEIITAKNYNMFVTFNGRDFDCPFIMLRSIYYKIKPAVHLMNGSDYTFRTNHIDLLKELTFYSNTMRGARRKFTLDFYCQKFGIHSPKHDGVSGDMVGRLFAEKKFQEIADYCIGDVIAENELFKFWNDYLNM
jgi:predicted PolB exonuclease-like 3'-5' exonuclease